MYGHKPFAFRCRPEVRAHIRALAERLGCSESEAVRLILLRVNADEVVEEGPPLALPEAMPSRLAPTAA